MGSLPCVGTNGAQRILQFRPPDAFARLKQLTDEGVVTLIGRTQNDDSTTFGIAIFEADSDEDAAKPGSERCRSTSSLLCHSEQWRWRILSAYLHLPGLAIRREGLPCVQDGGR
jgi:hypothetical protein